MKILIALSRFPLPTDKGDKLRAWNQIQGLAKKHDIYLFCLSDEPVQAAHFAEVQAICKEIRVFSLKKIKTLFRLLLNIPGSTPFQVAYFNDPVAKKEFSRMWERIQPDVVYCQLARMAEYGKILPASYKVIDYQDAFSKGIQRRMMHENPLKRIVLSMEYERLKKYEAEIFPVFQNHTIISAQDAALIEHEDNSSLHIVPNGVDTEYYMPEPSGKTLDLLFTGNMQYEPNVNCVQYLVKKVFPLLTKELPHIQLVVAGKNPARELRKMDSPNMQLTGWVEDLRTYYRQARIFVAPMQIGIGMQNKILEAMAMGMPVITSSLANNAIGGVHGKNIWIADTPAKVAEGIVYLINNTEHAITIGRNARQLMISGFSWQKQNEKLESVLKGHQPASIQSPLKGL